MKPMPYTLYQSDESKIYGVRLPGSTEFRYLTGRSLDHRLEYKKLTDAECAAEYWRARLDAVPVIAAWRDSGGGIDETEDAVLADHEIDTWHRFATTPHASEVD